MYLDIFLFLIPLFFIFLKKPNISFKNLFKEQGLNKISLKKLINSIFIILILLVFFSYLLCFVSYIFNISDLELVSETIIKYSILKIIYLFVVRVFIEEWFFRAFLVPRLGLFFSSFVFALAHFGYGSIIQIFGAFALGFLLSKIYSLNKNILPNFFAHMLYNFLIYLLLII
jgi:uncharacterized protein